MAGKLLIYALLIAVALICAFPFLWMGSTSIKADRELFSDGINLIPLAPSVVERSPYIDLHYYERLPSRPNGSAALLEKLQELVSSKLDDAASRVDPAVADREVARGLYLKLSQLIPADVWSGPDAPILAAAEKVATPDLLSDILHNVERGLILGPVRFRDRDLQEVEPLADKPISQRWENESPTVASFVDLPPQIRRQSASVLYDFTKGSSIVLNQTFHLPFDAGQLQRLQLAICPDDSWHDLALTIEAGGQRWIASRSVPMANFDWQTVTWQWPSDDENSLKIKSWIPLQLAGPASPGSDPGEVRLTLRLDRAGVSHAWLSKLWLNYQQVLNYIPFSRYLRVSLFVAIANIVLTLAFSPLIAYAFARLRWPGREFCFVLMLATMMIPPQVLMIPHFLIWKSVGAYNTLTPLWLGAIFGNAFYIFLLRQFMKNIPPDLEEAARIDGCGFLRIYWHVILPLVRPSLAAIAIFTFLASWNDFMGPLLYVADQRFYPIAFGLYAFAIQVNHRPTIVMAASLMMTLPIIGIFLAAQKYFVQGITLTGMKG